MTKGSIMKTFNFYLLFSLFVVYSNSLFSSEKINNNEIIKEVKKNLPSEIDHLFFNAKTIKEIEKKLGKPSLKEKNNYYYELQNFKYSLSIVTNNDGMIKEINFKVVNKKSSYKDFYPYIKGSNIFIEGKGTHKEGRYFSTSIDDLKLTFKNNSKKKLYSLKRSL